MKAIVMNGTGGREMLEYVERSDPVAGPGQALVEIAFAGVNFMDIGVRQGTVWNEMPNPKILGVEGVGRVVADSDGVEGLARGQRVAWVSFVEVDKRGCMTTATTGGVASYVELLTCLEMSGRVKNGDGNPRGPQTPEVMRRRAPGVTVGVGHDPITPGQKPGRSSR